GKDAVADGRAVEDGESRDLPARKTDHLAYHRARNRARISTILTLSRAHASLILLANWYGTGSGSHLVHTESIDSAMTRSLLLPVPYHSEINSPAFYQRR